ncbi:MAG TPA: hypothetical protein VM848_04635 [Acidimicrobiia bacterium]|nr:hypothetical protein [Acidimicrobiia bacterium]
MRTMKRSLILAFLFSACGGTATITTAPATTTTTASVATPTNPQSVPDSVTTRATTTTASLEALMPQRSR